MAKAPTFNLKNEDFQKLLQDYPEMEGLIRNLNRFATSVSGALNRGNTFAENIASQEADVDFESDDSSSVANAPIKVALKLPTGRKPKHVSITRAAIVDATSRAETPTTLAGPAWATDGTNLLVSGFGLLAASTKYRVTLLIVGG